jgi:hypothetical protein
MSSPDFSHEVYEGYHILLPSSLRNSLRPDTAYGELKVDGVQPVELPLNYSHNHYQDIPNNPQ